MKQSSQKKTFFLHAPFKPAGSQPEAIVRLTKARPGVSTLVGVTGSGKTFTLANVIANQHKPVLIMSPNKTLAAQLYEEFSLFFPENKVCYFVSYYDYYQPESYLPAQDIYIPKETKVNSEIERLRIEATASMINRHDTIVIASVSCIYSLGNPADYRKLAVSVRVGQELRRQEFIKKLIAIQYKRDEIDRGAPGTIQACGPSVEVNVPYQKESVRVEFAGNTVSTIELMSKHNRSSVMSLDNAVILPAKHFVTTDEKKNAACASIRRELDAYAPTVEKELYRDRIVRRVMHDLELIKEIGYCSGIENYSAHFDGRHVGQHPYNLFDFVDDFLLIIDESHIAVPQLHGMYAGDRVRKKNLIEFGFRLPSAYDNRPLKFEEVKEYFRDVIFVSATPGDYELASSAEAVEQFIRPTGLVDPPIEVHPRVGQLDHLVAQISVTRDAGFRSLVTVLTKKMAEDLARYLQERRLKVCYLHSELKTQQRTELLQKLRSGVFDCLVGVNLLREGLDLPEVALVAIMDADVESFLRDKRSLIQTIGRAARNTASRVLMYADKITKSMRAAIDETDRRRTMQEAFNEKHGITPTTVTRDVTKSIINIHKANISASKKRRQAQEGSGNDIIELECAMNEAAERLDFEAAIALREKLRQLQTEGP